MWPKVLKDIFDNPQGRRISTALRIVVTRGTQRVKSDLHIKRGHHPPTGRRKAPPDDRLRRMIQYSPVSRIATARNTGCPPARA
jgi:hypothetical protein